MRTHYSVLNSKSLQTHLPLPCAFGGIWRLIWGNWGWFEGIRVKRFSTYEIEQFYLNNVKANMFCFTYIQIRIKYTKKETKQSNKTFSIIFFCLKSQVQKLSVCTSILVCCEWSLNSTMHQSILKIAVYQSLIVLVKSAFINVILKKKSRKIFYIFKGANLS